MKKILIIICLIIIPFLTTGCYDNIELNNLAIISGLGIDYENNEFILTYEILNDVKTEDDMTMKSFTITGKGQNFVDAFNDTNYKIGKKPYFSHLKVVLLSENIIKYHLEEICDYLLRDTAIRDEFITFVTKNRTPEEILNTTSNHTPVVSDMILNLVNNEKYNNNLAVSDVFQKTIVKIISPNSDAVLNSLLINENNELTLSSFYLLNDYKMVTNLTNSESSLYNLLSQNTFALTFNKKYNGKNVAISLTGSKTDIEVTDNTININLKLNGKVLENNAALDLKDEKTYQMLNKDFSQIITQDVTNLIKTIQESGCDILSFSDLYFKKYRKENHNLWQHADIKVTTDLKINTKGFIFELKD